MYFKLKSRK